VSSLAAPEIHGTCDPRFAGLRDALSENFAAHGELGASVTLIVEGRTVAELWGGWRDEGRTEPWRADTLVSVFSIGKAFAALCALRLVDAGVLELDRPLAHDWPEFAAGGKDAVTLRHVLSHRSGLPAIERMLGPGAAFDWRAVTAALAAQEPWWEPGSTHGYHVHTLGFLVGELVRRVTGQTIGTFLRREIARPLGADVGFGVAPVDRGRRADYLFSVETLTRPPRDPSAPPPDARLRLLRERAYTNPPGATGVGTVNGEAWLDAELPSANMHATATGIARVYAALIDPGAPLLRRATVDEAIAEASFGDDVVLARRSRFGLGFQLTTPERPLGPNPRAFGHFGAGGALGLADPDAGVAFGYAMNRGGPRWQNPRNRTLLEAVYAGLRSP
jgi:CubicO group peptidase (beta-lactamase class C family)